MSKNLFNDELKSILTTIQDSTESNIETNLYATIDKNIANWKNNFVNLYTLIFSYFKAYIVNLDSNEKADIKFNITTDINDYINDYAANKIKYISDTTKQEIKYLILKHFEENNRMRTLQYNLRQLYSGFNKSRAKRIARTEVAGISNYGMLMGAIEANYKIKTWIHMNDDLVRDTHIEMDNHSSIELLEYFTVGNSKMQYPGDQNGEAKEVINCRCTLKFDK